MNCIICGDQRSPMSQGSQGREIDVAPTVTVWLCYRCTEDVLLTAARTAFYEEYQKVKE